MTLKIVKFILYPDSGARPQSAAERVPPPYSSSHSGVSFFVPSVPSPESPATHWRFHPSYSADSGSAVMNDRRLYRLMLKRRGLCNDINYAHAPIGDTLQSAVDMESLLRISQRSLW